MVPLSQHGPRDNRRVRRPSWGLGLAREKDAASCTRNRGLYPNPKALRTHIAGLTGPKTLLYKAFGLF